LRGLNSYTEKNWLDLYCEFLPMLVFAVGFFGYMVVLIFTKWTINWNERMAMGTCGYDQGGVFGGCSLGSSNSCYDVAGQQCTEETPLADMCPLDYGGSGDGCQPPNLITTLIGIVLQPGFVDEPLYEGQAGIQNFLLALSFIAVPWLLLAKPLLIKREMDKRAEYEMVSGGVGGGGHERDTVNPLLSGDGHGHDDHGDAHHADGDEHGGDCNGHDDHGDFTEIVIHQAIETIEFVLGMVSNTASYLRLWALSLAHTELAAVFWEKCLLGAIESNNPLLIFIGFAIFAMVTIGVLLCMDVLECFLHALRLHWVEFQSKFYKADGVKFAPYSLKAILEGAILE
jgi:V-type H+-transporting ATPase subunit a